MKTVAAALLVLCAMPAFAQTTATTAAVKDSAAVTTDSGLVYQSLREGTGSSPAATDIVRVHYKGTFPDGKEFDSSYKRGQPTEFSE